MSMLVKLGHRTRPSTSTGAEATVTTTGPNAQAASSTKTSEPVGVIPEEIAEEPPSKAPVEANADTVSTTRSEGRKRGWHKHWIWPTGLAVAGLGSAATLLLRGCWHTHMSWPQTVDHEFSYQVCTSCGIKRLYDEKAFQAYGPYGYDVDELIASERAYRAKRMKQAEERRAQLEKKRSAD
jgi:hypothetical protein